MHPMRMLGERSLVSFLKVLIDIAYWGLVGAAVLLVLALVPVAVFGSWNLSLDLPARFAIDPSAYEIAPRAGGEPSVTIEDAEADVLIKGVSRGHAVQGFVAALLAIGVSLAVLFQLRGIFRSLREQRPFVHANVRRIRALGLALMVGELLRAAMVAWSSHRLGQEFVARGVEFEARFEPSTTLIFSGFVLLVLAEVFREAASMKQDLETAREIQFSLVPAAEFRREPVTVRSHMRPANTVGGDYYDVVPLDDGKIAVVQADVAGKGMPAALLMATLQGSLRTLLSAGLRGRRLVDALNDFLHDNTPANRMVTLFYGELDPASGVMEYVNAGHNRPIVIRRDGTLERPVETSMVLGILPRRGYPTSELRLERGERLLLYTDGISEARDPAGTEYGDTRVADYLRRQGAGRSDEDLVDGLVADVLRFCGTTPPHDDMTLTLIRREGDSTTPRRSDRA